MGKRKVVSKGVVDLEGSLATRKIEAPMPPIVKKCYINSMKPRKCTGECRGATTHWHWVSCGYGRKVQQKKEA